MTQNTPDAPAPVPTDPFERIKNLALLVCKATGAKRLLGLESIIDRVGALVPNEPSRSRIAIEISRRLITTADLHDSQSDLIADQVDHLDDPKNAALLARLCVVKEVAMHMKQLSDARLIAGMRVALMAIDLSEMFDLDNDEHLTKLQGNLFDYGLHIITGTH